jgi:integrase/recombinase XerD
MGAGLTKQSKVLSAKQESMILGYLENRRNSLRNQTIFLLSCKSGLRAKEIAGLKWKNLLNGDGKLGDTINLTNDISKGRSGGREIPVHKDIKPLLVELFDAHANKAKGDLAKLYETSIIKTERSDSTTPQVIVNFFHTLYKDLGLVGFSSHSGRRTFITNTARKVSTVGGSLRDIQYLAGHSSLQTTERYIDHDSESQRKVVDLI